MAVSLLIEYLSIVCVRVFILMFVCSHSDLFRIGVVRLCRFFNFYFDVWQPPDMRDCQSGIWDLAFAQFLWWDLARS